MALIDKLKNIGDAIRTKTGKADSLTLEQMPVEIEAIETGITPEGTITITENGTYDVTQYASAEVQAKEDLNTVLTEQEAVISELKRTIARKASSDAKMPSLIEGTCTELTKEDLLGVTKIRDYAFYYGGSLKKIYIPGNVKQIGKFAFSNFGIGENSLESIYIEDGVISLGEGCFSGTCPFRKNTIRLPQNTLTALPSKLFFNNQNMLGEYIFGDQLTSVGSSAFESCYMVSKIELPDTVQNIGERAFVNCLAITSFKYPANLTSIPNYAFQGDRELVGFVFPNNLLTIGTYAFSGCKKFAVAIPDTVTSIGNYAFSETSYEDIELPPAVTSIPSSCFSNCSAAKSITIGDNVTSIGSNAFYNCNYVTTINFNAKQCGNSTSSNYIFYKCGTEAEGVTLYIGNKVEKIPDYIFSPTTNVDYSINIKDIVFKPNSICKTIGNNSFRSMNKLRTINIPESVTSIGTYAFSSCTGLKNVTLTKGITQIGTSAFQDCSGLEYIDLTDYQVNDTLPTLGSSAFKNCPNTFEIRVVPGIKTKLSTMTNWSAFANNIVEVENINE